MNIRTHLPFALLLVLLAIPRPRAETLAQSDATYQSSQDKIAGEAQRQEESLAGVYRKRLESAKAGFQRAGDLPNVLAADALLTQFSGTGAAPSAAAGSSPVLAKDAATYSASLAKLQANRVEQLRKLGLAYALYLEGKVKEHTKAGRLEEAQAWQTRLDEVRSGLPAPLAAPAATITAPPSAPAPVTGPVRPVKPESLAQRWRALARDGGLDLRVGNLAKERDIKDLEVDEASGGGFVITTPKNPGAYHKLLLGGGPLQPGDEIRIVAQGIYTFEFVAGNSPSTALSTPPPSGERPCEVVFRRTATGGEMVVEGKARSSFSLNGMKQEMLPAFWAGDVQAAVTLQDSRTVILKTLDVKRAAPAKERGR